MCAYKYIKIHNTHISPTASRYGINAQKRFNSKVRSSRLKAQEACSPLLRPTCSPSAVDMQAAEGQYDFSPTCLCQ